MHIHYLKNETGKNKEAKRNHMNFIAQSQPLLTFCCISFQVHFFFSLYFLHIYICINFIYFNIVLSNDSAVF